MSIHKLFNLWRSHHPTHVNMAIWGWGWGEGVKVGENEVELWDILKLWQKEKKFWWRQIEYFFLVKKQTNKKPESDLHFPGRLTDRYNTQRHTVTNTQERAGRRSHHYLPSQLTPCAPGWSLAPARHSASPWLLNRPQSRSPFSTKEVKALVKVTRDSKTLGGNTAFLHNRISNISYMSVCSTKKC